MLEIILVMQVLIGVAVGAAGMFIKLDAAARKDYYLDKSQTLDELKKAWSAAVNGHNELVAGMQLLRDRVDAFEMQKAFSVNRNKAS